MTATSKAWKELQGKPTPVSRSLRCDRGFLQDMPSGKRPGPPPSSPGGTRVPNPFCAHLLHFYFWLLCLDSPSSMQLTKRAAMRSCFLSLRGSCHLPIFVSRLIGE
ncbi:hypothetical protein KP509_15G038100 [Ceratopteris richardii]|uniref:Uncharacterized protein n=1 Tax=Ceratopteris richardii TaxID=49495 RepID=A0A8T2T2I3_CERRI|nr:hypothetical protein KP509_15G038100 [Ceratopteris richardii]